MQPTKRRTNSKQKIFDATLNLLEENVYAQITVDQIIAASGVAKQTFYNQFRSKQEVVIELSYRELFRLTENHVDQACDKSEDSKTRIATFFKLSKDYLLNHGEVEKILMKEGLMASADENIAYYMEQIGEQLSRLIEPASKAGKLNYKEEFCVELLGGTLNNIVINWTNIENYKLASRVRLYTDHLNKSIISD